MSLHSAERPNMHNTTRLLVIIILCLCSEGLTQETTDTQTEEPASTETTDEGPRFFTRLVVVTDPPGAEVHLSRELLGLTPFDGWVFSDRRYDTIRLSLSGYESEYIEIDLCGGKAAVTIEIELEDRDCDDCIPIDERNDPFGNAYPFLE